MYSIFFFFSFTIKEKGENTMLDAVIVGKVIKHYREKKGISQEVLSGFADIGRTHLSAIERGERKPTLETFYRISLALEVKASELWQTIENEIGT